MPRQFTKNNILNLLPEATYQSWAPYFETVELPMGKVLYEPGSTLSHMYFPTTAIVSWVYVLENGAVKMQGEAEMLRNDPRVIESYLGLASKHQELLST